MNCDCPKTSSHACRSCSDNEKEKKLYPQGARVTNWLVEPCLQGDSPQSCLFAAHDRPAAGCASAPIPIRLSQGFRADQHGGQSLQSGGMGRHFLIHHHFSPRRTYSRMPLGHGDAQHGMVIPSSRCSETSSHSHYPLQKRNSYQILACQVWGPAYGTGCKWYIFQITSRWWQTCARGPPNTRV